MFRATQIASEETLPVLTAATLSAAAPVFDDKPPIIYSKEYGATTYGVTNKLPPVKHKYPVAVFFVLAAKFFEAFAANGIRTILALYLRDDLLFSENFSTSMLHIFNFFGQFLPILGAILADSYLGNVRTISGFCFLYAFGWALLILTSFPNIGISLIFLVSVSLLLIAIGNGSIRACITSLGAMQFKIPEQAIQLAEFFSLYYFIYYLGIFMSKILPPMVRAKTQCFDKEECYPAVFGMLAVSFVVSWVVFCIGKFFYKTERLSEENVLIKFYGCVKHALVVKWSKTEKDDKPKYWLHNAVGKYDQGFVNDVAKVLKLFKLFIPLPIYFALLVQQDSTWTFQASMMNTTIAGVTIQPDQAKAMGPVFLFILIPLWHYVFKPLLEHCCQCQLQPLHTVTIGGVSSALSFVCAGILEEYITNEPYRDVNVAWQVPQFVLLMLGELLLSIPGLQFAFTQAPASMKSVVTAAWFVNNAFGNLIVVLITEINFFSSQSSAYFFYAMMMLVSIIIFTLLAYDYVLQERSGNFYANLSAPNAPTEVTTINEKIERPSTSTSSSTAANGVIDRSDNV